MDKMKPMGVLVACEESQIVTIEFRKRGHEAYSCDLQACSGGHPEWHIIADVFEVIQGGWFTTESGGLVYVESWDMLIGFPPCTYLTYAGIAYFNEEKYGDKAKERKALRQSAVEFFLKLYNTEIPKVCIENPVGYMNTILPNGNRQKVQPYFFGDPHVKGTCLWLRGLPKLNGIPGAKKPSPLSVQSRRPGKFYKGGEVKNRYFVDVKSSKSAKERSKTFPGIARAMAQQWSPDLSNPHTQ